MKKNYLLLLFFFISFEIFAENVELKIILQDGIEYTESFDKDSKSNTLVSKGNFRLKELTDIQGLEQFENLTNFCMYFFQYKGNYSFLKKIKNLKDLGLIRCGAETLNFLEDLTLLENCELELDFAKENQKSIETIDVNLEKLKYIKKITINNRMSHIPPFVKVRNKPELLLDTTNIKNLNKKDFKYAKQYSVIKSLNPNPQWYFEK